MGKSRKSTIRKFEFYETITDNGIESGYVRLANTQFHSDAVMDLSANSYESTICDPKFHPAFNMDELKRIAITFHSSKGLEFEQVVLFVSDYRLSSEEDVYNHYVASTRAKTKLILVYVNGDWNAGQFAKNINNILGKSGLKMKDVATIVNCTECISD